MRFVEKRPRRLLTKWKPNRFSNAVIVATTSCTWIVIILLQSSERACFIVYRRAAISRRCRLIPSIYGRVRKRFARSSFPRKYTHTPTHWHEHCTRVCVTCTLRRECEKTKRALSSNQQLINSPSTTYIYRLRTTRKSERITTNYKRVPLSRRSSPPSSSQPSRACMCTTHGLNDTMYPNELCSLSRRLASPLLSARNVRTRVTE